MTSSQSIPQFGQALRWALETTSDPATAAADWLARDINPERASAVALLTARDVPLKHLQQAKDVYKTMRVLGETSDDRRMGGRLYLAAIAAALVVHEQRISRQSDRVLAHALKQMVTDESAPMALQALAYEAIGVLKQLRKEPTEQNGYE